MLTSGLALMAGIAAGAVTLPGSALGAAFSSQRLAVTRQGVAGPKGRDIVLIAGLASGPDIWKGLAARLSGHRLHLVHIAGFAHMPAGANAAGPLLSPLVEELARYLKSRAVHAPVVIGHSMGGTLAMMLALRRDMTVDRLMVVDMLPEGAGMLGGTAQGLGYLAGQLNGYLSGTKAGRQLLARMVMDTPGAEGSDPQVVAQALTELAQTDLTPRLAALTRPLKVVYALPADRDMAASQQQRYRAAYASARTASLTGIGPSGHAVMLDQPARFAEAVSIFLK
ncbi:MAG: alpha/beta hydrolase [Sphingobium sp. 32-64-5]|nr:MAG: alpha/beta hydrolase [Sphingobium sp. 32-64-5]